MVVEEVLVEQITLAVVLVVFLVAVEAVVKILVELVKVDK